ncbi:beta-galactosidase [Oleiharenicola lentus]|uniref:Beta-galactosidase n=1 Tax=Oleiharenicola lentus TaxID=2508720 RepID=A0A4Q1C739_9BACT|nr:beta-galactosidase [Oleiharenicola lentus]RXK54572.1 beta-galactosidase [Oleiharenicola lentus]
MNKLLHGTCYYPELWPESEIPRDIAEMKKLGLNMVRIGEFTWSKMEPDEGRVSVDFFVRVLDQLHAAGIGVVYCTPTPTPPVWLTHGHPDRCFVDAEGRVMSHGARQHASYEHPVVRAACLRIVETLASAVGRHPAIIAWQIDNEFKCHVGEDFNPHAVAHWHRWLEARFGTIEKLNDAWGTEIWSERYQRFDQVPAPVRTPFLHNASLSTAYRMFCRESIAEFMDAQCAVIRRHSDKPITHNTVTFFSVNQERLFANLDFASFDDYPPRDNWPAIVFDNDLCRPAKPGRAHWFMETSVAHNGWFGNHEVTHPPGFLAAEAVVSFGLGAQAINYWLWRQQRTGCELPHSAILSTWFKPSVGYTAVEAVEAARRQLEPLMLASKPAVAEAAVTWSDLGRAMLQTEPLGGRPGYEVDFNKVVAQWHGLLLEAGIHRDVRFEGAALDGLKLLITPVMPFVSPDFLKKVEKFVRAGGVWICAPTTGTRGAEHTVPTDAGLGLVDAFAGVETVFSFPITGTGSTGKAFGLTAPVAGWCSALRPATSDTRVLGTLKSEQAPGLAFLTERRIGQGAVVVLGALPDGKTGAKLLAKLVAHYAKQAGVTLRFDATPGTVVCPRATADGETLWVVVNLNGKGGRVRVPKGATDALTGKKLPAGPLKLARYGWRVVWI